MFSAIFHNASLKRGNVTFRSFSFIFCSILGRMTNSRTMALSLFSSRLSFPVRAIQLSCSLKRGRASLEVRANEWLLLLLQDIFEWLSNRQCECFFERQLRQTAVIVRDSLDLLRGLHLLASWSTCGCRSPNLLIKFKRTLFAFYYTRLLKISFWLFQILASSSVPPGRFLVFLCNRTLLIIFVSLSNFAKTLDKKLFIANGPKRSARKRLFLKVD